jgi:5'-3' exonuclease
MKSILLIDADSLVFAACLDKKENTEDGKGFMYDIEDAKHKFDESVQKIVNTLEDDYALNILEYKLFLEGEGNFRYLFNKGYKSNRKDRERPPLIKALEEWVIDNHPCFVSYNVETDDTIAATYTKYHDNDAGVRFILASMDKDLKTIPCVLFDYFHSRYELMEILPDEALKNFYMQMLMGDTSDGVVGIRGVGKKGAEKNLEGLSGEFSFVRRVYTLYKREYGRKAKEYFIKHYLSLKLNVKGVATPDFDYTLLTA